MTSLLYSVVVALEPVPGSIGDLIRSVQQLVQRRRDHVTSRSIFPMPWIQERLPARGRTRTGTLKSWDAVRLTNVWLALLNYLHDGLHLSLASWQGSVVQQRAQLSLLRRVRAFLRRSTDFGTSGDGIRTLLKTMVEEQYQIRYPYQTQFW